MANTSANGLSALVAMQRQRPTQNLVVNPLLPVPTTSGLSSVNTGALSAEASTAFWQLASAASIGLSAYHGYKRNNGSLGWGIGWGLLGAAFPIITPAIAFAEGFAKPK